MCSFVVWRFVAVDGAANVGLASPFTFVLISLTALCIKKKPSFFLYVQGRIMSLATCI